MCAVSLPALRSANVLFNVSEVNIHCSDSLTHVVLGTRWSLSTQSHYVTLSATPAMLNPPATPACTAKVSLLFVFAHLHSRTQTELAADKLHTPPLLSLPLIS